MVKIMYKNSIRMLFGAAVALFSGSIFAANYTISTAADIDNRSFCVGDTITVAGNAILEVMGDCVASVDASTITIKHPGFTYLRATSSSSTESYVFSAYEPIPKTADVFFVALEGSSNWDSLVWTKVTSNTDRAYPNAKDDVAIILNKSGSYRYVYVPEDGITIGQLVVANIEPFTIDNTSGKICNLIFERTDGVMPRITCSGIHLTSDRSREFRLGDADRDNGENYLNVSFVGPEMEIDFSGDSVFAGSFYRKSATTLQIGRAKINVAKGQIFRVTGASYKSNSHDALDFKARAMGEIRGEGIVENYNACFANPYPAKLNVSTLRDISYNPDIHSSRFGLKLNVLPPNTAIEAYSAANRTNTLYNSWVSSYGDVGVENVTLAPSILLSGSYYEFRINGSYSSTTNYIDITNIVNSLVLRGHAALYTSPAYGPDNNRKDENGNQCGRVRQRVFIKDFVKEDAYATMELRGFAFRRSDAFRTNELRGTISIENWEDYAAIPEGVAESEYDTSVFPIIPWLTCTANDNGYNITDNNWATEQAFPVVLPDGSIRPRLTSIERGEQNLLKRGENDNFYYWTKSGFKLNGENKTIFSLVYKMEETPPYAAGGNYYVDAQAKGATLSITSGAMVMGIHTGNWLGQPVDMTKNGRIALLGSPSYIHTPAVTKDLTASSNEDHNIIWSEIIAKNDLVKGGIGFLGVAGDQRGVEGVWVVNGGELSLGYPKYLQKGYLYHRGNPEKGWSMHGAATSCDFLVRGGARLALASNGYTGLNGVGEQIDAPVISKDAVITLQQSGKAEASILLADGVEATCKELYLEDVTFERGTWGSSLSAAEHIDDVHFAGTGVLKVRRDNLLRPTTIIIK